MHEDLIIGTYKQEYANADMHGVKRGRQAAANGFLVCHHGARLDLF